MFTSLSLFIFSACIVPPSQGLHNNNRYCCKYKRLNIYMYVSIRYSARVVSEWWLFKLYIPV